MKFLKLLLCTWIGGLLIMWSLDVEANTLESNALALGLALMIWGIAGYLDGEKK